MRSRPGLVTACAGFRVRADDDTLPAITRLALRDSPGVQLPDDQLARTKARLKRTTSALAPALVARKNRRPGHRIGDPGQRRRQPAPAAQRASLRRPPWGVNPIPASTGKTVDIASTAVATGN